MSFTLSKKNVVLMKWQTKNGLNEIAYHDSLNIWGIWSKKIEYVFKNFHPRKGVTAAWQEVEH